MSDTRQAVILAIAVTVSTALAVHRQEWLTVSVGCIFSVGAWVQVGVLLERWRMESKIREMDRERHDA